MTERRQVWATGVCQSRLFTKYARMLPRRSISALSGTALMPHDAVILPMFSSPGGGSSSTLNGVPLGNAWRNAALTFSIAGLPSGTACGTSASSTAVSASAQAWSDASAITTKSSLAISLAIVLSFGFSVLHTPHHDAQKLSSTTLPRKSESLTYLPVMSCAVKSGAGTGSAHGAPPGHSAGTSSVSALSPRHAAWNSRAAAVGTIHRNTASTATPMIATVPPTSITRGSITMPRARAAAGSVAGFATTFATGSSLGVVDV